MTSGVKIKKEREEINATIEVLTAVSGVSNATISKWERGLIQPSAEIVRAVLTALHQLQCLRMKYDGISIDLTDIRWVRTELKKNAKAATCAS